MAKSTAFTPATGKMQISGLFRSGAVIPETQRFGGYD
jgi:hypothetical protein